MGLSTQIRKHSKTHKTNKENEKRNPTGAIPIQIEGHESPFLKDKIGNDAKHKDESQEQAQSTHKDQRVENETNKVTGEEDSLNLRKKLETVIIDYLDRIGELEEEIEKLETKIRELEEEKMEWGDELNRIYVEHVEGRISREEYEKEEKKIREKIKEIEMKQGEINKQITELEKKINLTIEEAGKKLKEDVLKHVDVEIIEVPDEEPYCNAFGLTCEPTCHTYNNVCDCDAPCKAAEEISTELGIGHLVAPNTKRDERVEDIMNIVLKDNKDNYEYATLYCIVNNCKKAYFITHGGGSEWEMIAIAEDEEEEEAIEKAISEMIDYMDWAEKNDEDCYFGPTEECLERWKQDRTK